MSTTTDTELMERVAAVRAFNRFYTQQIGVLHESVAKSPFSLTEVRGLYELADRDESTDTELGAQLSLDPGYLSRILMSLKRQGLIRRKPSAADGRQRILQLTKEGAEAFAALNLGSQNDVMHLLGGLAPPVQRQVVEAMQTIERLLGTQAKPDSSFILRPHQIGDIGWIIQRHGIIYAQEYGWNEQFEGLVARIPADFLVAHDPKRERCWVAEREVQELGCVFLVANTKAGGQHRVLLVEPQARAAGVVKRSA